MPASPLVAFIHSPHVSCPLVKLFRLAEAEVSKHRELVASSSQYEQEMHEDKQHLDPLTRLYKLLPGGLAGRILSVNTDYASKVREVWVRVSGAPNYIEALERVMRKEDGIAFQRIFGNKFNIIYRVLIQLDKCPTDMGLRCLHLHNVPGVMVKSSIVHPRGMLYELIVAKPRILNDMKRQGFEVILVHEINGYDYMLTLKQELVLLYAYLTGYYRFPRSTSLKALAEELGLSVSTLAELLRKAESKVVEAFIRHEMPHYLVNALLNRNEYRKRIASLLPAARNSR